LCLESRRFIAAASCSRDTLVDRVRDLFAWLHYLRNWLRNHMFGQTQ